MTPWFPCLYICNPSCNQSINLIYISFHGIRRLGSTQALFFFRTNTGAASSAPPGAASALLHARIMAGNDPVDPAGPRPTTHVDPAERARLAQAARDAALARAAEAEREAADAQAERDAADTRIRAALARAARERAAANLPPPDERDASPPTATAPTTTPSPSTRPPRF